MIFFNHPVSHGLIFGATIMKMSNDNKITLYSNIFLYGLSTHFNKKIIMNFS